MIGTSAVAVAPSASVTVTTAAQVPARVGVPDRVPVAASDGGPRAVIEAWVEAFRESAPNARDGRSHLLRLSEAGRRLYGEVAPKALELERRIVTAVGAEEAARFTLRHVMDVKRDLLRLLHAAPPDGAPDGVVEEAG